MNSNETKDKKDERSKFYDNATRIVGIAGAVGAVIGLVSWLGSSSEEKMMKAPGKDGYIPRNAFENNPKDYFKDLRDTSEIDLKIHGPTRQVVLRLGPDPASESDQDSDEEGVIRMIVSTLKGKTFNIKVKETETIRNVKTKIPGQGGPPVDEQRLMYEGRQLIDNWRTVAHYKVKTGSTLVMMSRLCGC